MTKVWNPKGFISLNEIGHHKFLVEFQKAVDIEHVINERPRTFDKNLVCIQPFDINNPPSVVSFSHEPFWI